MNTETKQHHIDQAGAFMQALLMAGFNVQSVLEHGFEYVTCYVPGYDAAEIILQAARLAGIDLESQQAEIHRSSQLKDADLDAVTKAVTERQIRAMRNATQVRM